MQPNIMINWMAIIAAVAAAMAIGFIWYGPLFGKIWGKGMGMNMDRKPKKSEMNKGLALQLIAFLLTAYVMVHTLQVWRPSVWGVGQDQADWVYGFFNALFIWVGFYLPHQLGKVAWEMRSWKVVFINMGHDFVVLLAMSMIIAHLR